MQILQVDGDQEEQAKVHDTIEDQRQTTQCKGKVFETAQIQKRLLPTLRLEKFDSDKGKQEQQAHKEQQEIAERIITAGERGDSIQKDCTSSSGGQKACDIKAGLWFGRHRLEYVLCQNDGNNA